MTDVAVVIQARMTSSRLPGKVLRPLGGRTVLSWVVRAARVSDVGPVVVATSTDTTDDAIARHAEDEGVVIVRGPLEDVLTRYLVAADEVDADAVVRLTADCPLVDPVIIRMAVAAHAAGDVDYVSTITPRTLPRGLDVEVVMVDALRAADALATGADRSHVTSYLYRNPSSFRIAGLTFEPRADDLRVTLDTTTDAALLERVVSVLGDGPTPWRDVVGLLRTRPDLVALNAAVRQKPLDEA